MTGRATPFHCPYCGEEDLRPAEDDGSGAEVAGAWLCADCRRVFTVSFVGLSLPPGPPGSPGARSEQSQAER
ncbi:Insertion element protein [Haloechinothrix sp. LS1_15]|uniref:Insertion element protein n=1 Tax=Haloechinothrix sp. LS1_15 TaxID=2652248 RepID=UPI0029455853|nr:Insertion element protein [Haloechinothrix sp. LS1_15]MDV6012077.1 Insertion element protein [Haloechinothrix sp. LS1_15]